jgi:hypothetical protein
MQHRFADYHAVQNGNCALTVLLEELTGERSVMIYLVPSVLLTIAIVGIYLAAGKIEAMKRRNIAIPEIDYTLWDTTIFSLGLLMGVLWAKPAWVHYFILCIPALLVIACPIRWNMKTWPLIALFLTFALSFPSLFAPLYGASMDLSYAVHFVALTVVLLAALLWKLYDDQEELGIPRAAPRRVN